MLPRTLEPEVMDSPEEANAYNEMDHQSVNELFVADLLAAGGGTGDILDLGAGTALIPVEICQRSEDCRVMAVDMAVSMLDLARYNVEAAGHIDRIQLDQVDAKSLPYEDDLFDAVISNSIVHHIPDPKPAIEEAMRVVKPGGLLYFRDLMRPQNVEQLNELVEQYAGNEATHARDLFRDSLHAALSLEEIQQLVVDLGYAAEEVTATSDRHWTWSTRKPAAAEA